ncbi:MAG: hypothetical protein CMM87_07135 [Rickettsiales bacterium]|nr:hypothetical protein [Rickettsiales bacterium]
MVLRQRARVVQESEVIMPGTKRPDVCTHATRTVHDAVHQLHRAFAAGTKPCDDLASSRHIENIRHLWVLAYINSCDDREDGGVSATPDAASNAVLQLERAMAMRNAGMVDVHQTCQQLKAQPAVVKAAGVMYVCNMLWAAIWWRHEPKIIAAVPSDLKILDLFQLDSMRRAAQVPELRAAALSVFGHRFELRPGERVKAQYQVPSSTARLSHLQALEFVRPAPFVVGLADMITFADMSVILRNKCAVETLIFAMFRARATSLIQEFDFVHCVWSSVEFEEHAGLQAVVQAARIKPIIVRWDVNRYHVCDNDGNFYASNAPQQVVSLWRHILRTKYDDTLDNRLSFAGLFD